MLKNFKYIVVVILATAFSVESVAQTTIYKDVLLDGKPAKLNTVTGEVSLVTDLKKNLKNSDSIANVPPKMVVSDSVNSKSKESDLNAELKDKTALVYEINPSKEALAKTDYHTVQKGETLYGLSRRYGATLTELKRANNLETTLIKTGQVLRVQNFDALYDSNTWKVIKGDTLYNIAKRTNTTVDELKRLNNLSSSLIKIGQILRLK
ncbi:LysM peptidoglycan-binding domain-containing protein [Psychroserpens sp.]|uniref:LysM peptidoglycan-binding domain-containing protein n=1 Tax=Psychroserpens sp. TaxID=2020870 RepID=UPI001B133B23|nr:LysM peptidoglycan-binding domain-containing protein [Psychroserpens sp.]MBO6607275.1 LysM peptidoglycan-binding domain-containing protein [Psychroserpens sp.]MBO6632239.1 LysM peptidoglycan-binding domain-containing protein [Psychroserpens sp.]MBO6654649.1 LysM peptidoglycan-binding domain-containing protein [Psychroserpens sp.]MBO6681004.1 LysM peptidoglycan-binding domain-containing protein [Psychroserpens sp.]MBO6750041.1 LysM peptidoglycan-binding domain-containing protein [Psychroserp